MSEREREASRSPTTGTEPNGLPYVLFTVGDRTYALASQQVRGIEFRPPLTPVPLVPGYLAGVSNVRGVLQPVIDLALLLGDSVGLGRYVVNVAAGPLAAGFLVDAVEEVAEWSPGAARFADRSVVILDVGEILSRVLAEITDLVERSHGGSPRSDHD